MSSYEALLERVHSIQDLEDSIWVLAWDRDTNMPSGGLPARIDQVTTLSRLRHEMFASEETERLIDAAAIEVEDSPFESNEASLIRSLRREFTNQSKLTTDYVRRSSEVSGRARQAWAEARAANDFAQYLPWLEQIVSLCQELADLYGYEDDPYDALLDKYETAATTAEVRTIFDALKAELLPLFEAVESRSDEVDDALLRQRFEIERQEELVRHITTAIGYDYERGHLGTVVHPRTAAISPYDARIMTRWSTNSLEGVFLGIHEAGHAIYVQGVHPSLYRTPLERGGSMGIHESQSRMMENMVGRSRGFWRAHFPRLVEYFPDQFGSSTAEDFYRSVNKVQPSLIRVQADELTYNLHIILRFDLERQMLRGDLAARDLPEAWDAGMQGMLGVKVPTNAEGCLQDQQWSRPSFGYFPTYALGNLYAAQFYEAAISQDPAIAEEMARGDTTSLLKWLREKIHQHGGKFLPRELVQRATGRPLDHQAFMRYVTSKYGELYRL